MDKRKKLLKPVLAEGEVTGHSHMLADPTVEVFENTETGVRDFSLGSKTEVRHEEHEFVTLNPGDYASGRVMEYDHPAEEARRVRD